MNKIYIYLLLGLTFVIYTAKGQSFKGQFNDLGAKKDTLGQLQLLKKWEKTDSIDPELFIAYFNYYVKKSKKEFVRIDKNMNGKDGIQVMDNDSNKKEPVAYLFSDSYYDQEILKNGFDYIENGIKKYPNRLDMLFGKIYMLGKIEQYDIFTSEIIKVIEYSAINNNQWLWTDNKPIENPKQFFLGSLQDYQVQLYDTENDSLLNNMKRIAETVLKYYPDHIESLSNLSVVFMLQKQFEKALEPLLKAELLNPKDHIVLSNIAQVYKLKGDTKNAIIYYELTIKYGDEQSKIFAQEQIEKLKKK